jgi:hypothetical protein
MGVRIGDCLFLLPFPAIPSTQIAKMKDSIHGLPGSSTNFCASVHQGTIYRLFLYFKFDKKYTGTPANGPGSGSGREKEDAD